MKTLRLAREIELILGSLASLHTVQMAFHSFIRRKRHQGYLLLTLLFLSLSIRIFKSLIWVYWEGTPLWFINTGFFFHSLSGPLLFLYARVYILKMSWSTLNFLHFLPSLFIATMLFKLNLDGFWYSGAYSILLFHQLAYALASLIILGYGMYSKNKASSPALTKQEWIWASVLILGISLLQAAYFSNYILGLTPYLLGPMVFAVFIYFLSVFALGNSQIFIKQDPDKEKYSNIHLSEREIDEYVFKIKRIMDNDQPYLDNTFCLMTLSGMTNIPVYLLSHVINTRFSRNFPDFVNSYRIEKAKKILAQPNFKNLKISSIAFDSGFSSLSSFNLSFRRNTGMTPTHFKKISMDL